MFLESKFKKCVHYRVLLRNIYLYLRTPNVLPGAYENDITATLPRVLPRNELSDSQGSYSSVALIACATVFRPAVDVASTDLTGDAADTRTK